MKMRYILIACLSWLFTPFAMACDYSDDPRLSNDQMPILLQALIGGQAVEPIRMRVGTYLLLGEQSRQLLEPHVQIHDANCKPVSGLNGELLGRAVISFEEYYRTMAQTIHEDRPKVAKQLYEKVRVTPMTIQEIQELFGLLPYSGSHGVAVRERMQSIFPRFATTPPLDKVLSDPLNDGRPEDYAMFKLFLVFGGSLHLDQGCGPYELDQRFYRTEKVKGLLGGEHDVLIVRHKPFLHMMDTLGITMQKTDKINYRLRNCN